MKQILNIVRQAVENGELDELLFLAQQAHQQGLSLGEVSIQFPRLSKEIDRKLRVIIARSLQELADER